MERRYKKQETERKTKIIVLRPGIVLSMCDWCVPQCHLSERCWCELYPGLCVNKCRLWVHRLGSGCTRSAVVSEEDWLGIQTMLVLDAVIRLKQ